MSRLATRLFETRGSDLLRYLERRVRTKSDARDIAQEAYLRFIRLAKPDAIDNPEAYLFRIASNLVWEHQLRRENETRQLETRLQPPDESATAEVTPFDLAVSEHVAKRVRATLKELAPAPRAALVLHLRDGLTYAAISTHMRVSVSTVKKYMSSALAHCRQRLRDPDL